MVRIPARNAWLLILACAAAVPAIGSRAQDRCGTRCAPSDLACRTEVAVCQTKVRAFQAYMGQIDAGRPKYELPAVYRDILKPHYPQVDFEKVRFAFSDQQPPDNATTDCNEIYFNDARHVDALRDAAPNPKWKWLLHELTHVQQCSEGGGRSDYALRWWNELETAVRENGETIDVFQTTDQLVKQLQALLVRVHGAMPMELAADAHAEGVLASLRRCCTAKDGTPIRPLRIGEIRDRVEPDGTHVLHVEVADGDPPFRATWRIKGPGDAAPVEQPADRVRGLELPWTPAPNGQYEIEVTVAQENPDLEPQTAARTVSAEGGAG